MLARHLPVPALPVRAVIAALVLAATLTSGLVAVAPAASAAARVTVTGPDGAAHADRTYSTTLAVRGSGFQSIKGGFGGIYVLFGWVDDPQGGSWRPSRGGQTGADYRYVPDSESKDNQGFEKFVAFPGSDTAYAANGGTVKADGTWSTTLVVSGPTFQSQDRDGRTVSVDCRKVRCGVITIGAHGVVNTTNETFTPVTFVDLGAKGAARGGSSGKGAQDGTDGAAGAADGTGGSTGSASSGTSPRTAATDAPATATLGVDRATAVAGHVLSFVAQGFAPGEQVVASFDDGVLAAGPLTAGTQGDVAGVLQLPAATRLGTHTLKLTGATSGQAPQVELTVRRDPAAASAADAAAAAARSQDGWSPAQIAVGAAALVLLAVVVSSFAAARRRRARPGARRGRSA
jgi:hypothetical protein